MTEASLQGDRPLLALVEEMALDDEEEVPLPHTHPAAPAPLAQKSEETAVLWHYVPLDDVPALVRNDPLPSSRAALVLPPAQVIPQQRQKRGRRGHGMRKKQRSPAARHGGVKRVLPDSDSDGDEPATKKMKLNVNCDAL